MENTKTFFDKLAESSKEEQTDQKRVAIAKKIYLINKEEEIKQAKEVGYSYPMIAKAATSELLETDLPQSFTVKTKEGEEKGRETSFTAREIKKFCETEGDA